MTDFTEYYACLNKLKAVVVPEWVFTPTERNSAQFLNEVHGNTVDLWADSYIIACVGHRGSGKTTLASALAIQSKHLWPELRILSNFPLKWSVKTGKGKLQAYQAEPLDLEKMVNFDSDYQHCLILLDEAPAILNRMSAASNKNKLLNLWTQQLRKNRNSLILCSQDFQFLDGEVRYQTDIIAYCADASRRYPGSGVKKGGVILVNLVDNSGQWTGRVFAERPKVHPLRLCSEYIWGTFDTYFVLDILAQLWRLEIQRENVVLDTRRQPGAGGNYLSDADAVLTAAIGEGKSSVLCGELYEAAGAITDAQKQDIGRRLVRLGLARVRPEGKAEWEYPLSGYKGNIFLQS